MNPIPDDYQAPAVEREVEPAELDREVHYAAFSGSPIPG